MIVELKDIRKNYGAGELYAGLDLSLAAGERVCLRGPSGCGKTTLARIILGLERPDSGSVNVSAARRAAVFQEDRLLAGLSAAQNIRALLPRKVSDEAIDTGLAALGIPAEQRGLPLREYSGGMSRRVAILRCMLAGAQLVVLDEPFNGLDAESRRLALAYIAAQLGDAALVFISHNSADADALAARSVFWG